MAKIERSKQGVAVYRQFSGQKFHWTGGIHRTKRAAQDEAKKYAKRYGANTRVVRTSAGYLVYARLWSMM